MLFKVLRVFGLDVPARFEAAKAAFEQRVEDVTDRAVHTAQAAAFVAALWAIAAFAAGIALIVGLVAVYDWEARSHGAFAGLGADGAILIAIAVMCAVVAIMKSKSLKSISRDGRSWGARTASEPPAAGPAQRTAAARLRTEATRYTPRPATPYATSLVERAATPVSTAELVDTLSFLLSKYVAFPRTGNAAVDELVGNLKSTSRDTAREAIGRAADMVRDGDRANIIVVLSGAFMVGWLLSRQARNA
jgi:hypothetical protein